MYSKLIGSYAQSFYRNKAPFERFRDGLHLFSSPSEWIKFKRNLIHPTTHALEEVVTSAQPPAYSTLIASYKCEEPYDKQEMLRDIFLWSVYEGHVDIAFVLLLQLKSRISAALIAACIARRLSSMGHNPQVIDGTGLLF